MENRVDDREINIIDMLCAICLKWRQICVVAVACAVLAGAFSYYQNVQSLKADSKPKEETKFEDIELEDEDERNVCIYMEYQELYNNQLTYNENASLMKLDANGFYVGNISYYIDNYFSVEYPTISKENNVDAMIQAYKAEFRDENFATKIAEKLELDETLASYSLELVDGGNKYGSSVSMAESTGVMTVSVYGKDEETCEILAQLVREMIESKKTTVVQQFGEHEITLIEDVCKYVSDANLREYQRNNIDRLYIYSKSISEVKTKISEDVVNLLQAYKESQQAKLDSETQTEVENSEGNMEESSPAGFSKKMIVIGFIGGMLMTVVFVALSYLFNGRLRLEDDFENLYGVKLLGRVISSKKERKNILGFVDAMILHIRHSNLVMFQVEDAIPMIVTNIKIACVKEQKKKIAITRNGENAGEKEIVTRVTEGLRKEGIEVVVGNTLLYDCAMVECAAESSLVVLVESANKVGYMTVQKEINICKQQGTKVVGAIIVAD